MNEAERIMTSDPGAITTLRDHDAYRSAVPTPDHFLPLMYVAGLADAAGSNAEVIAKGYAYGSLSMTAYRLD